MGTSITGWPKLKQRWTPSCSGALKYCDSCGRPAPVDTVKCANVACGYDWKSIYAGLRKSSCHSKSNDHNQAPRGRVRAPPKVACIVMFAQANFNVRRFPIASANFSSVDSLISSAWFSIREIADFFV